MKIHAMLYARRLRDLMAEQGLSAGDFARLIGRGKVGRYAVDPWLNGERFPPINTRSRIALALGVSMESLHAGDGDSGAEHGGIDRRTGADRRMWFAGGGRQRTIRFSYTNWRGEVGERVVRPISIEWTQTDWHPEPQWILHAFDLDRDQHRSFAMRDMKDVRNDDENGEQNANTVGRRRI